MEVECDAISLMADVQRRRSGLLIDSMIVLARVDSYVAESVVAFVHLEHPMVSISIDVRLCCELSMMFLVLSQDQYPAWLIRAMSVAC